MINLPSCWNVGFLTDKLWRSCMRKFFFIPTCPMNSGHFGYYLFWFVLFIEESCRTLSKICDLIHSSLELFSIFNQIFPFLLKFFLVSCRKKYIEFLFTALIFSKNKVNPKMKVFADKITLKSSPHCNDKLFSWWSPRR